MMNREFKVNYQSQEEQWFLYPKNKGLEVSNHGNIRSFNTKVIYYPKVDEKGVVKIVLNNRSYVVQYIVAETFLEKPEGDCWVRFINGNRFDFHPENLEYIPK